MGLFLWEGEDGHEEADGGCGRGLVRLEYLFSMSKVSAAAIAATGVGGSGAAALGVYGMGYFGDGTGSGVNFNNPKHKELLGAGHT